MVSVLLVTWNSARFLPECLASIDRQEYRDAEVIVVDNASSDATREMLRPREGLWHIVYNARNAGFAAAQNQANRVARGDWLLCLNPDVMLAPDFIERLGGAGNQHPGTG